MWKEEAPDCGGQGGTRQRRPDLAPGSPPHAGVSGTATRGVLRPNGSCPWGIHVPGCRQPWAPIPQRGYLDTQAPRGQLSGGLWKPVRSRKDPAHTPPCSGLTRTPWASSRALKADSQPCAWNLCQVCPPNLHPGLSLQGVQAGLGGLSGIHFELCPCPQTAPQGHWSLSPPTDQAPGSSLGGG